MDLLVYLNAYPKEAKLILSGFCPPHAQIGLGDCEALYYKGCINTEFFDLDDPSSDDFEEESVPSAHKLVLNSGMLALVSLFMAAPLFTIYMTFMIC